MANREKPQGNETARNVKPEVEPVIILHNLKRYDATHRKMQCDQMQPMKNLNEEVYYEWMNSF